LYIIHRSSEFLGKFRSDFSKKITTVVVISLEKTSPANFKNSPANNFGERARLTTPVLKCALWYKHKDAINLIIKIQNRRDSRTKWKFFYTFENRINSWSEHIFYISIVLKIQKSICSASQFSTCRMGIVKFHNLSVRAHWAKTYRNIY